MEERMGIIVGIVNLIVSGTIIYRFFMDKNKARLEEGRRLEIVDQLRKDMDRAFTKIRDLEAADKLQVEKDLIIQGDLKLILSKLDRIEPKLDRVERALDRHIGGGMEQE